MKNLLRGLAVRRLSLEDVGLFTRRALRKVVHIHDTRRTECNTRREAALAFLRKDK
jgi:hypothetical protein